MLFGMRFTPNQELFSAAYALKTGAEPAITSVHGASASHDAKANLSTLESVPYLGSEEPYFFGGGVAGAGGDTGGKWDFLIGPDYTSPNFISQETLSLVIDGKPTVLAFKMHRARGTGIFFGSLRAGGLRILVADFSNGGSPWVARLVRVENLSPNTTTRVSVRATIKPGGTRSEIENSEAIRIEADKGAFCFGNETKNWAARGSLITFSDPCVANSLGSAFEVTTKERELPPGKVFSTGLYHYQYYVGDQPPGLLPTKIRSRHPEADMDSSIAEWHRWLRQGKPFTRNASDQRAWDAVEASLLACKMQQNRDGGTIAGARKYANSYVRDTHGAVRLFLATGHCPEARRAIETIHHKWSVAGFIPNYWSMGSDSFLGRSFVSNDSEITGYYVLMIRDYYAATKDRIFVDSLAKSIKFAVDSQLDFMAEHGWRMNFNGDETEQYCVRQDGQEYGGFPAFPQWRRDSWSFPSAVLACASAQFYADYLAAKGDRVSASVYRNKIGRVRDGIDATFWGPDKSPTFHSWARYKDDSWPDVVVPNYCLIPLWIGARLNKDRQLGDAIAAKRYVVPSSGYLPTAPPVVTGFCGHNLGYLLFDLTRLRDPAAQDVYATIMHSRLLGCWGTVSEFYGPLGTPNGHNFRVFESGITAEAIVKYLSSNLRP